VDFMHDIFTHSYTQTTSMRIYNKYINTLICLGFLMDPFPDEAHSNIAKKITFQCF
jgi:hypothetical protein